jgi:16S rRNA (uracil1498-N3)-methyltransferase
VHRFYIPPDQTGGDTLFLTGREAHHALHVLRVRHGDRVSVLNGAGIEFACEVRSSARDQVELRVSEKKEAPEPAARLTLLQAIPKGKLFESIIQKATELGAACIVPLLTERVVVHLDEKAGEKKAGKWQMVAIEAMKQCGTPWLPKLEEPMTPAAFLARKESFDLPLVGALLGGNEHPSVYFRRFREQHGHKPKSICFWIGPEGDFTPEELELIKDAGALPITLGSLVLRTETAATYCLVIANYEVTRPDH